MGCQLCRNDLHDENEMSKDPNTNQLEPNNKKRTLKSGRHITPSKTPTKNTITLQAGFSVDSITPLSSDLFAVGLSNGVIAVYQIGTSTPSQQYTLTGHTGTVRALIKLNDGRLCSASGDSTIKIWRLYERRLDVDLTSVHTNWVNALLQPKESDVIISGGSDNTIKIINLLGMNQIEHSFTVEKNVDCMVDLDSGEFAANSGDSVIVFNWKTKEKIYEFEGAFSTVVSMAYVDGHLIAGAVNGTIKIYDMSTKQKKSNIKDNGNLSDVKVIEKNIIAVAI